MLFLLRIQVLHAGRGHRERDPKNPWRLHHSRRAGKIKKPPDKPGQAIGIPFAKTGRGITFRVKVEPRSSRRKVMGIHEGALKVKLTSPPVEGKANEELIEFLADLLGVRKSDIKILRGGSSKQKTVEVAGLREFPPID
ncbi:MAG: DUF167 domain-containing protein [Nitrospiraceae bacterium]|nr:DUF167 domain-containing protein [Nitrospiraceae bacterium]